MIDFLKKHPPLPTLPIHIGISICVRTIIDTMHSRVPDSNLNHHTQMPKPNPFPDPNQNPQVTMTLKQSSHSEVFQEQMCHIVLVKLKCPHETSFELKCVPAMLEIHARTHTHTRAKAN